MPAPTADNREMIDKEQQSILLAQVVSMFEATPNIATYTQLVDIMDTLGSQLDLCRWLASTELFRSSDYFPDSLGNTAFAEKMCRSLLGLVPDFDFSTLPPDHDFLRAYEWISDSLSIQDRGTVIFQAIDGLRNTSAPSFAEARARLENRIEVAAHYVENGWNAETIHELRAILSAVDASSASVLKAIQGIDATPQRWTFMVYMVADNNLEPYALEDIREMAAASTSGSINLTIAIDRSAGYDNSAGDWTDTRSGLLQPEWTPENIAANLTSLGELNMGDPMSLTSFIDWSSQVSKTDRYALILWNHGLGVKGLGVDEGNNRDVLALDEIRVGIERSSLKQLDLIGFDACSMSMLEVAAAIRGSARVMVAAEDLVPLQGWNYTKVIDGLDSNASSPRNVATTIMHEYGISYPQANDASLSAFDLSQLSEISPQISAFAKAAASASVADWRIIEAARQGAPYFFDNKGVDLPSFIDNLLGANPSSGLLAAASTLSDTLQQSFIAPPPGVTDPGGIAIYWPQSPPSEYDFGNYSAITQSLGLLAWHDFLLDYWQHT
ncbi:clostripain-related cysteine peptidase [Azonexus sp.]|uniref:clostripain-related cysteine peptidase n=1 Tax=Azonexus sp. TaxID=1872668 RepID=UPI0027BA945D|nr:clostripain-related cysteine peptidase [Azonexus sp.]